MKRINTFFTQKNCRDAFARAQKRINKFVEEDGADCFNENFHIKPNPYGDEYFYFGHWCLLRSPTSPLLNCSFCHKLIRGARDHGQLPEPYITAYKERERPPAMSARWEDYRDVCRKCYKEHYRPAATIKTIRGNEKSIRTLSKEIKNVESGNYREPEIRVSQRNERRPIW